MMPRREDKAPRIRHELELLIAQLESDWPPAKHVVIERLRSLIPLTHRARSKPPEPEIEPIPAYLMRGPKMDMTPQ